MQTEMKYIYTVYQKGSFSKAAKALYLTQPALSIAVQKVEERIGMPLFDRSQKPLRLTEAGEIYIEKIQQIQHLEDELSHQLQDLSELNTGNLRIGATSYFFSYILPPVLLKYKKKYPGINLDIVEAGAYELKELLKEKKIDLTFESHATKDNAFIRYFGFQDRLLLVVPAEFPVNKPLRSFALTSEDIQNCRHLDFNCPAVNLTDLAATPFVLLEAKYNLRKRSNSFFEAAGIAPPVLMEAAQMATVYALAEAGIGATFISDRIVTRVTDRVLFYKLVFPDVIRDMNIVVNRDCYISQALKLFIETFTEHYQ